MLSGRDPLFAIPTKRNNGARYIPDLYERGVRNFVVTSEDFKGLTMDSEQLKVTMAQECNFLIVPNTLKALQKLAEQHRGSFQIPVVGITGSNGKTIVKNGFTNCSAPTGLSCVHRAATIRKSVSRCQSGK